MFAAERVKKIMNILLEYKHIDVNTLCTLLSCSVATVRRDLDKLEKEGFLIKAYGGAILNESKTQQIVVADDGDPYLKDKQQAAAIAATLVNDDDIVFLGAGTTCLEIARRIKHKNNLTVITPSLDAAYELSDAHHFHVIVVGGDLDTSGGSVYTMGMQAIRTISSMFIGKSFFTVQGISKEFGYTVSSYDSMNLLQSVLHQCSEAFVVADSSKFNRRSLVQLADIRDIRNIITNVEIDSEYKDFLFSNKVKVYTSFDEKQ
jgi:DeoR/GlpR family transcriptional regulator of sugar metabolism